MYYNKQVLQQIRFTRKMAVETDRQTDRQTDGRTDGERERERERELMDMLSLLTVQQTSTRGEGCAQDRRQRYWSR